MAADRRGGKGLAQKYGPWAAIAGASAGLGAAFARELASRGMNLILVARRRALLLELAGALEREQGVQVRILEADLADPGFAARLSQAAIGLELGLAVYNAAYAPIGEFAAMGLDDLTRVVDTNVRGPVALARELLPAMAARGRGALILMSSLAGGQGSPKLAAYAASKAFTTVLAESLWRELRGSGVDVLACCAAAIRTPSYAGTGGSAAPGAVEPEVVARAAIRGLGRGPIVVPGAVAAASAWIMRRLVPRRAAIGIMAASARSLSPSAPAAPAPAAGAGREAAGPA